MSYLSHDERRQMILETAVKIAFSEGLTAMTVRKIAQEAQCAVGQIHRHFSSASELKAEAFLLSVTQALSLLNEEGKKEETTSYQLLNWCLFTAHEDDARHYSLLWKEAEVMSYHDDIMMNAIKTATMMWHGSLVSILEKGISQQEFECAKPVATLAWDMIAFSHGFDGLGFIKMAMTGSAIFGLASLAAACSETPLALICARALLASGAAMIVPATLAAVRTHFPDEKERNLALGIWTTIGTAEPQ